MFVQDLLNFIQNVFAFGFDFVVEVGSIEGGLEEVAVVYTQSTDDILFDDFGYCGSQGENGSFGESFLDGREIFIFDAKLLTPG